MSKTSFIICTVVSFLLVGSMNSCLSPEGSGEIKISGRQIMVDGSPYLIRGICYNPVPKGSDKRNFSNLTQDLALMVEAGINTVRVYQPIDDKAVLDEIDAAGIKIIMGFGFDQGGKFDMVSGTFIDYVNTYKDHKAILLWELGNEYNYHPQWFNGDVKNWYTALNNAAGLIKKQDASHPVTTAHGELPDALALASCPNIDVWGMNVYRWDEPGEIYSQWESISSKPMYLSEAGGDSYMTITKAGYEQGVNEKAQAAANAKILESVFSHTEVCSGVTLFAFADEWWKAGNNEVQDIGGWAPNSTGVPYDGSPNEEYWGILDIDRNKKETYDIVKTKYRELSKQN
ncbi:glycoside hydrolase family 2 TIM barrel-domain containing protein [Lutimonas vermicola]|uniref:Glycoside hydrolase family 2 TIM barrel-domain containing protein n=1 Tax=Lutimonas vermicola TaxID=414288 RepID=A0ABU9L454_9FLAO